MSIALLLLAASLGMSGINVPFGLIPSFLIMLTSLAKTCAAGAVESIQFALMEMTIAPPFLRKWWALRAMIRA